MSSARETAEVAMGRDEAVEQRDALGNRVDPTNPWRVGCPWWFDTNRLYERWRRIHDEQINRAMLEAAR